MSAAPSLTPALVNAEHLAELESYAALLNDKAKPARELIDAVLSEVRDRDYPAQWVASMLAPARTASTYAARVSRFVERVRAGLVDPKTVATAVESVRSLRG